MAEEKPETKSTTRRGVRPAAPERPTEAVPAAPGPEAARFHFFLIDSGWDSPVAAVIRKNLGMIQTFQNHDPLFVLTREQSAELIRHNPHFIGKDPILLARDLWAKDRGGSTGYHGFHLKLGKLRKPADALHALQEFLQFLAENRKSQDIEEAVKKRLHQEGLKGAVEVIRSTSETFLEG